MPPRSPNASANAIILKRQSFTGCFLVVEGTDDRLFFKKFVDPAICHITEAYGKEGVIRVVSILETESFPGVVGIVDADFDNVEQNRISSKNIVVLDTVDLEALLIRSPSLDAVLAEWGSTSKIAAFGKDIKEVLLEAAVWVGCLRLYSYRTQSDLIFRRLKYKDFIDQPSLTIDIVSLVRKVLNRSQKPGLSIEDIIEELQSIRRSLNDYWLICYGKDMIEILTFALKRRTGSNRAKNVKPESLNRGLRQSFHLDDLNASKLAHDIYDWELRNQPFQVLKPDK